MLIQRQAFARNVAVERVMRSCANRGLRNMISLIPITTTSIYNTKYYIIRGGVRGISSF